MLTVTWFDGTKDEADTPDAMLARLARKQMDDSVDIRIALCKRAYFWGDVVIDPEAPALTILKGLKDAGMLKKVEVDSIAI